jgi:hypothetical protein
MKPMSWIAAAFVALAVAGCAGSPPTGKTTVEAPFPPDQFLTAEAAGTSEAEAKRAAMAELAAIFESRVYARTLQQATSWIGEGLSEQFDKEVEQTVHIQTDVQLEGARIGRTWRDESTGGLRALAVLDRRQAASRWQRELATVQMTIAGQVQALDTVKGRLSRLAALNRITSAMVREAVIESRLSVLGRPVTPASQDLSDIIAQREQLAHAVALFIQLDGNPAPPFTRRLTAQLTADGYTITTNQDEATGLITGTITVQALDLGNPDVRFIRAMAAVQLVDMDNGMQIAAFDEDVRKGHVDEEEAARRAVNGVANQVAWQLARALGTLGVAAE